MSQFIEQKHLDLVAKIYDVPLQPKCLQSVLDEFSGVVNSAISGLTIYDPVFDIRGLDAFSSSMEPEFVAIYRNTAPNDYKSPFANLMEYSERAFIDDIDMLKLDSIEEYAQRPMMQWLNENYNLFRGAASRLNLDGAWVDVLFMMYSTEHGPVTTKEKELARLFLDHFAKAIELGRTFGVLKNRFNATLAALDKIHMGIFLIAKDGTVILKNTEAQRIIDGNDGMTLSRDNKLYAFNTDERAELKEAIEKTILTSYGNEHCAEYIQTISRNSNNESYLVEISPIRDKDEIESDFKGCLVFVIDPSKTDVVSINGMNELYSLTNSESQVCRLVAEGLSTEEIAESRNITKETVRGYIKQVLQKTGTKNRSQLVRLALKVNLPIDTLD